jgi:hypothetical protein
MCETASPSFSGSIETDEPGLDSFDQRPNW